MNNYTVTLILLLGFLGVLIYGASIGLVTAIVTLAVIATVALIAVGAGIVILAVKLMAEKEQKAFRDNTKENLAIMNAMQTVQNKQNAALLQQVGKSPVSNDIAGALLIEDGIFAELED